MNTMFEETVGLSVTYIYQVTVKPFIMFSISNNTVYNIVNNN